MRYLNDRLHLQGITRLLSNMNRRVSHTHLLQDKKDGPFGRNGLIMLSIASKYVKERRLHRELLNGACITDATQVQRELAILRVCRSLPKPSLTKREEATKALAPLLAVLLQVGAIPLLYLRNANSSYDETYLNEGDD